MPIYIYECDCGQRHELLRPVAERDDPATCLVCGAELRRQVTSANFGKPKHRTRALLGDGRLVDGTWEN